MKVDRPTRHGSLVRVVEFKSFVLFFLIPPSNSHEIEPKSPLDSTSNIDVVGFFAGAKSDFLPFSVTKIILHNSRPFPGSYFHRSYEVRPFVVRNVAR